MNKKEKKLIEYLNQMMIEQWKETRFTKIVSDYEFFACNNFWDMWLWYETIFSKKYWFIKWLVENNKIDIERLHKIVDYILVIKGSYVNAHDYNSDCLLMLLSIQDSPIQFLIDNIKV